MHYTEEERAEFRRAAEKAAARKAYDLTADEKATLISLVREYARTKGPLPPLALKQWASDLLGRELPNGELPLLVRVQLETVKPFT